MSLKKMLLLFAVASQGSLFAQKNSKDSFPVQTLDPLVVTANKFPQKQSTTGKVITVIDKKTIDQNAGKTVAQLLNEVAGITVNGALNNAGTNQTFFLRGASSGRTLILMDGIPVFDASQINNEFDLNQLSLNNVESIEVCKGPQSTLYGSDAVAGVVNIITVPQNVTKPLQGSFTNSFGSFGTLKSALQLFGKQGKWQYNTRVSGMKTNGFSAAFDSVGNKNFDADAYKGTNAMASITYQANKNWQWRNFVHTNYYRSDADAAAFADKKNFYVKHRNTLLGTSIQNQTTKYKWQVNYQYNYQTRFFNDNADVVGATSFSTNSFQSKSHFAEAFGNIRLAKQWEVLVGVDYRHNTMRNNYSSMSVWGPFKSQFNDTSIQQLSAYSSLLFKSGKWHVELGGRWNNHSKYGNNATFTFNPSYKLTDKYRLFGSISSGFKAPSLYQLYADINTGFPTGNPNLKPEKSLNYELGYQTSSPKFSDRMVFFYRTVTDGIDYNFVNFRYYNYVSQKVGGFEYEFTMPITSKWLITGNYTYITARETAQNRQTTRDTITYQYVLRRPNHQFFLQLTYQPTAKTTINLNTKFASNRFDVGGFRKADAKLNAYAIVNISAMQQLSNNVQLFGDVQNLLNHQFFDIRGYNSIPRIANIGIRCNW